MDKKNIETFIKKYHLGGMVEKIRWTNSGNILKATAMTTDKKLLANVELANFSEFGGINIVVGNTSKLQGTLSGLPESISVSLEKDAKNSTRVTGIIFSDKDQELTFPTLDESQIDGDPKLKTIPPFEVEIPLTAEFVKRFVGQIG